MSSILTFRKVGICTAAVQIYHSQALSTVNSLQYTTTAYNKVCNKLINKYIYLVNFET